MFRSKALLIVYRPSSSMELLEDSLSTLNGHCVHLALPFALGDNAWLAPRHRAQRQPSSAAVRLAGAGAQLAALRLPGTGTKCMRIAALRPHRRRYI